jgi:hypothetical protein
VGDVDNLHVKIDNLNDPLVGFCFIRSIDFDGRNFSHFVPYLVYIDISRFL